jgi:hypothetical protein
MAEVDEAYEHADQIIKEAHANLNSIVSEEDSKVQIITRLLTECLGWSHADVVCERQHENGYSDYVLKDRGHQAFLVEAKRIGRINLKTDSLTRQYYKLNGPTLRDANTEIRQAANYCNPEGIQLAVLTDGLAWIIFLPHTPNGPYIEKQAIVFPTMEAILSDFVEFFSLLSKTHHRTNTYKLVFDKIHENRLVLTSSLTAAFSGSDIERLPKSALSFDLEKVFSKFFSNMIGENNEDLLVECFVETRESQIADFALEE